ncbi:hypothetical protein ACH9L7_07760 [Haloferax sp. S1W]|uniref:hypothetical protein n=1 Tax=Haloferax sp. S1W TaxID=3377110 RepID=UPI0037C86804
MSNDGPLADVGTFETPKPTATEAPTTTEERKVDDIITTECTDAYITDFEWTSDGINEDKFTATVINQGDVAGEVIVKVTFYESENEDVRTGSLKRRVAISAQESKDILISANPPTDDSSWASMLLDKEACIIDTKE